ncbi:MAG: MmcQ/YjbR family DNA-binding protein [Actinomycetota bacterium]|nr:MmcQ/YjbR family DNA-binding protein [Actinomycetota bacterium]
MSYDELISLCLALPGAWPDEPWGDGVVAKVGVPGKIFAFPGPDPASVAVKLRPEDVVELRATYPTAVGDAPYLSRKHWVRVLLDGEVPDDELGELVEQSYAIVVAGLPKAQRPGSPK